MRRDFVAVAESEVLDEALDLMRMARLRHLPVVRDGELVGILSYRDLLERLLAGQPPGGRAPVGLAMVGEPVSVRPGALLREAAARMCDLRVGCLPVVEDGAEGPRLVGIVTESDLLRAAYVPR